MRTSWIFDLEHTQAISERRKEFLGDFLHRLPAELELATALDAGCGVGFFSSYLASRGLEVLALDAREQNVAEARRRHPKLHFQVGNVEDLNVERLGQFDLVLCFGLLYHLENPFRAIRNLYRLTGKVLLLESLVAPFSSPAALLVDEPKAEDQGMDYVALVPSTACLVKMLYRAGFPEVWQAGEFPNHREYRETLFSKRRRTVLAAGKVRLQSPLWQSVGESSVALEDLWDRTAIVSSTRRVRDAVRGAWLRVRGRRG